MNIVYQSKTKSGKEIVIRYPEIGDEKEMCRYINELSREKTFVRFQGEEISLKDETEYLKSQIEKINEKKAITLLVFYQNKIIAISGINMMDKTEKHIGRLGISVAKDFRGEGIGKLLMKLILEKAKKEIPLLRIVVLEVYSTNGIARGMYKKLGFVEYGRLPNGIIRKDRFEDSILMYLNFLK